jgi:hypothetical protein
MKLSTDCAPKAMMVEVAAARNPVSRLMELRMVPCAPPKSEAMKRSPAAIKDDEGPAAPLAADATAFNGVLDARSTTWRIISESPALRDNALNIDAIDKSIPRETACSDSPRFRATPSISDRLSIEDNEVSSVDINTSPFRG